MAEKISYEGISWCLGTTSFRTKELNRKIELQLDLLDRFWKNEAYKNESWKGNEILQQQYYKFLWENDFTVGNAPRPAKDAREKTSGLADLGLIERETRRLTGVGRELLDMVRRKDFQEDNFLYLPSDSFLYLKQLMKLSMRTEKGNIRPFFIFIAMVNTLEYLTKEEFAYFLPLVSDQEVLDSMIYNIQEYRNGTKSVYDIIREAILKHKAYQKALDLLLTAQTVTENLIITVMMNRKSANYSKPFYRFYKNLHAVLVEQDFSERRMQSLEDSIAGLKTAKKYVRQILYKSNKNIIKNKEKAFCGSILREGKNEKSFRKMFFCLCHWAKTMNNLSDYGDLNFRYFSMSDCLVNSDDRIQLDFLPKIYFALCRETVQTLCFSPSFNLLERTTLEEISSGLAVNEADLNAWISKETGFKVYDRDSVRILLKKEKYRKFQKLLSIRFTDEKLLQILELFKNRKTAGDKYDEEIKRIVSPNADGPTSFEYILAVVWYKISECHGDVLEFMNLSLDASLLPKTHAGGGEADIVWKYEKTKEYPEHTLLIEATLSDRTNQRRMEMEPVSRHLGEYLLENKNTDAYCIFIANFLHINVIADFRMRMISPYYGIGEDKISGMRIAPLETEILAFILKNNLKYPDLYQILQNQFSVSLEPKEWYADLENKILSFKASV